MREEDLQFKKFVEDLANRAYKNGTYTYTKFLDPAKCSIAHNVTDNMPAGEYEYFGGCDESERVILRFGNIQNAGYEEQFPISILMISPLNNKFADVISHRDVLGAVLNLGLSRDVIGDIYVGDDAIYLFCHENVEEFIRENLTRIKHTTVNTEVTGEKPCSVGPVFKEKVIIVPSLRTDLIISKVFHISRSESELLFSREKVFINGRLCSKSGVPLRAGDTVSVRGCGKFIFDNEISVTKKGNTSIRVRQYV